MLRNYEIFLQKCVQMEFLIGFYSRILIGSLRHCFVKSHFRLARNQSDSTKQWYKEPVHLLAWTNNKYDKSLASCNHFPTWMRTWLTKYTKAQTESIKANISQRMSLYAFHATGLFVYPLKTSGNQNFSGVFRKYRIRPVTWNRPKFHVFLLTHYPIYSFSYHHNINHISKTKPKNNIKKTFRKQRQYCQ